MRAHGANRQLERLCNLFVRALFLMVEHQDGLFYLAQQLELLIYRIPELPFRKLLFGILPRMLQPFFPLRFFVRKRDQRFLVPPSPFPFILRDIGDDAIEISAEQSFAAKRRQGAVEAQKDLLRKIIDVFAATREANERAEDHGLMVSNNLLEGGVGGLQEGSDCHSLSKFHESAETLRPACSLRRSEREVKHMDWHVNVFMIPIGAFAVAIVAIVAGVMQDVQRQRLKADQRLAMVARGMSAEDIDKLLGKTNNDGRRVRDPIQSLVNTRRTALILISSGLGLVLFFVSLMIILNEHDVLAGAPIGLIPLAIGVGFLIDYKLQKRDLSRFGLEVGPRE